MSIPENNGVGPVTGDVVQECGCRTITQECDTVTYIPCLGCALKNAGLMLIEAGKRLYDADEKEREEMEERAEAVRVQAEDFIGGTD